MPTVRRPAEMAMVRDLGVQKLRDLTIAVALASAAAVALIAWVSAATIPGTASTQGQAGNTTTTDNSGLPFTGGDDGFNQRPPRNTGIGSGPGIVVSGGSHP
ncbi:MAG TPA: hypothetical protein VNU19_16985 [Candidatus Acidoferrum sp.]|jgi:hypothetical protein|nr:hypothetical protein [Candidatus Acidoferrum sp.]